MTAALRIPEREPDVRAERAAELLERELLGALFTLAPRLVSIVVHGERRPCWSPAKQAAWSRLVRDELARRRESLTRELAEEAR